MGEYSGRITIKVGTPEHTAFRSATELARDECRSYDEGFYNTASQHLVHFNEREDYTLLQQDFQYIWELAALALRKGHLTRQ